MRGSDTPSSFLLHRSTVEGQTVRNRCLEEGWASHLFILLIPFNWFKIADLSFPPTKHSTHCLSSCRHPYKHISPIQASVDGFLLLWPKAVHPEAPRCVAFHRSIPGEGPGPVAARRSGGRNSAATGAGRCAPCARGQLRCCGRWCKRR